MPSLWLHEKSFLQLSTFIKQAIIVYLPCTYKTDSSLHSISPIDCPQGNSLLYWDLQKRFDERAKRQQAFEEEEQKQKAQESLIKQQMKVCTSEPSAFKL